MQVGIVVYYQLNKTYITQKLCENKSNPKMNCNGHCYLSKQLKKAEDGEKKQAQRMVKEKEEVLTMQRVHGLLNRFPTLNSTSYNPYILSPVVADCKAGLEKPPTV